MSRDPADEQFVRRRLSLAMISRNPDRPLRFWFCAEQAPHLLLEPLSSSGRDTYVDMVQGLRETKPEGARAMQGVALADSNTGGLVFVARRFTESFVEDLAWWVRDHVDSDMPFLAGLIGAGYAVADVDLDDDKALKAIDLQALEIIRVPSAWAGVGVPTIGQTASILEHTPAGRGLWFWMWPDAPAHLPMLLVQPVAADPNLERLEQLAATVCPWGALDTFTGLIRTLDDGRIELVAPELVDEALFLLSEWVKAHVDDYPALGRLRGARMVATSEGRVSEVVDHPEGWEGVPAFAAPGTRHETTQVLQELSPGDTAWFWMTCTGDDGEPFLSVSSAQADPDAHAFQDRLHLFATRWPHATDAMAGTVQKLASGRLAFATTSELASAWPQAVATLKERWELPALQRARLVQLDDDQIIHAMTAAS